MRILFLVSSLGAGGAERVAVTLCSAWVERGDQVTLMPTFSGRGECFYKLPSELRLIYLADLVAERKHSLRGQFSRLMALREFLIESQPDLIVSFLTNVNVAAIVASIGLKIPLVVSERTDPFVFPVSAFQRFSRSITYPFADALVVQTQAVASKFRAAKTRLRHLYAIPNPLPQSILGVQPETSKRLKKRLLSVGRLDEGKQFGLLIRVFSSLVNQHRDWSLRIVGDGPLLLALQQQIVDLGIEEHVELPGRTDAVWEELAQADAFALTSKFEGFPNALLEAMAVGLPCVVFDCPSGPREISLDGEVAVLVPLNDEQAMTHALRRLMNDAELRRSLGDQARNSVIERFTLSSVVRQWDMVFSVVRSR